LINLNMQTLLIQKKMLQRISLIACAIFASSCASGIDATLCIVDSHNYGFQCMNEKSKDGYFLSYRDGAELICASPSDTEVFLKACKKKKLVEVALCSYVESLDKFGCLDLEGNQFEIENPKAENFVCLSLQDRTRLIYRCQDSDNTQD
jgi:hypothetical protein